MIRARRLRATLASVRQKAGAAAASAGKPVPSASIVGRPTAAIGGQTTATSPGNPSKSPPTLAELSVIDVAKVQLRGVRTLVRYADVVADENGLNRGDYFVKFIGTERPMPSFAHRSALLHPGEVKENIIFESTRFSLE